MQPAKCFVTGLMAPSRGEADKRRMDIKDCMLVPCLLGHCIYQGQNQTTTIDSGALQLHRVSKHSALRMLVT